MCWCFNAEALRRILADIRDYNRGSAHVSLGKDAPCQTGPSNGSETLSVCRSWRTTHRYATRISCRKRQAISSDSLLSASQSDGVLGSDRCFLRSFSLQRSRCGSGAKPKRRIKQRDDRRWTKNRDHTMRAGAAIKHIWLEKDEMRRRADHIHEVLQARPAAFHRRRTDEAAS